MTAKPFKQTNEKQQCNKERKGEFGMKNKTHILEKLFTVEFELAVSGLQGK